MGLLKAIEAVGRAFTAQHSSMNLQVVGGQSDYGKIIQSLALTLGPDLIDPGALAPYATRGVLRPLDAFLSGVTINASNYPTVMWQSGQWSGKTYGVPALDHGPELGLLLNHALTGVDVSAIDSWDKLFSFGLSATKKGRQGIDILGWDPLNGCGGLLQTVESMTGQSWFDPATKQIELNNPTYQAYLDRLKTYYQTLGVDAVNAFRTHSASAASYDSSGLGRGTEVAVVGDYRLAGVLSSNSKASFGVSWMPASPGTKAQRVGGRCLAIPNAAKRPDDSWLFLSFLAGDEGNRLLFNEAGRCAWTNSFLTARSWQKNPLLGFYGDSLSQSTALAGQPISPIAGYAQAQWQFVVGAVIQNTASPADALKSAQSALETELQRLAKANES